MSFVIEVSLNGTPQGNSFAIISSQKCTIQPYFEINTTFSSPLSEGLKAHYFFKSETDTWKLTIEKNSEIRLSLHRVDNPIPGHIVYSTEVLEPASISVFDVSNFLTEPVGKLVYKKIATKTSHYNTNIFLNGSFDSGNQFYSLFDGFFDGKIEVTGSLKFINVVPIGKKFWCGGTNGLASLRQDIDVSTSRNVPFQLSANFLKMSSSEWVAMYIYFSRDQEFKDEDLTGPVYSWEDPGDDSLPIGIFFKKSISGDIPEDARYARVEFSAQGIDWDDATGLPDNKVGITDIELFVPSGVNSVKLLQP